MPQCRIHWKNKHFFAVSSNPELPKKGILGAKWDWSEAGRCTHMRGEAEAERKKGWLKFSHTRQEMQF